MKHTTANTSEPVASAAIDEAFDAAALNASGTAGNESPANALDFSAELAVERDRNLRLRAELENVRARTARELVEQHRYASLALARDLLPVLDNIDRAIAHAGQSAEGSPLLEGFRLVRQQLADILKRHDCVEIAALGEPFDPQLHAAILQQPSADVSAQHVMLVSQTGYRLHDRVVRPAQVIVSSGAAS